MDPLDAIEWNNKGITYHGMKLFEEANEAYDRAIAIDPENPIFWNNKEKLSRDIRKQKSTKLKSHSDETAPEGKKTKSEYAIYWNNKGAALYHQGFESEALAAFDRAISLDPTHPIFWKNKAKVLRKTDTTKMQKLPSLYQMQLLLKRIRKIPKKLLSAIIKDIHSLKMESTRKRSLHSIVLLKPTLDLQKPGIIKGILLPN